MGLFYVYQGSKKKKKLTETKSLLENGYNQQTIQIEGDK